MKLAPTIKLIRLDQYIKNLFIFLPLFFGIKITDLGLLSNAFIAFIAFSLTASAIYTLNDYHDIVNFVINATFFNRLILNLPMFSLYVISLP